MEWGPVSSNFDLSLYQQHFINDKAESEKPILYRVGNKLNNSIMAQNNFFNVVNASGGALTATIDGKVISVPTDGAQSTGHTFSSGESITAEISGNSVELNLPGGVNSWSTLVYTTQGLINVFPSAPNQGAINY